MRTFSKLWLFAWLAGAIAPSAFALDVVQTPPPQAIADNQLTIGERVLRLPEGSWNLVAQHKGSVTANGQVIGAHYKVYALDAKDGVFRNGVQLQLPDASFRTSGWLSEPCKVEGALFKDDFNSGFKTPECLTIYKRSSHLSRSSDEFYSQAKQWAVNEKVKLPGAVYEITYTKYAVNEFGQIRIWVPVKNVSGDDAIIAWAQALPERLRRLFEKRDTDAALPPIPSKF